MAILVEFEAASSRFVLGPTLEAMPSLAVELERQYALDPAHPIAFCWIHCDDFERLERALATDRTVDTFEQFDRTDERSMYRIRRSDSDVVHAYCQWVSVGGELLECRGADGQWTFRMRFPDREAFAQYHDFLEDENVHLALDRLADSEDVADSGPEDGVLTDPQREALELAFEYGFFEVPRETDLGTIAAALDVSSQAISERLRRGQARLVETQLFDGG
ncbi:helix-turn-helix domain-containing protein [Natronobacterium gregoryi]|uniref:Bacterio-opsin activator n=2 Tax=Natronobacterium gregoryi TaxID=44930 RepID=L0AHI7_NATGS|nr:helix-turn-helix domain-containing protein [Natronobacterium gregoryi]AFZ73266.1 putative DNA binding protein [Natronobacterium gregoryi SP2]ELY71275.1 bacterio-opsin activator HTH domain-containing protein [Natronobacterium gregoryi SP2]PLK18765.1 bacterio-opsin activator [Natronobacterium gregoryi SP2]SFJ64533.1 GAF and HTH_10 associated domain-containing protein [Natronobacterium gregoryi]